MDDGLSKRNEVRIEDISVELNDLKNQIESITENTDEILDDLGALQVVVQNRPLCILHWILPENEDASSCDLIQTNEDAQIAFKLAAVHRDNEENGKPKVRHGDLLLLLCNSKEENEETGCYFMGVCVENDDIFQEDPPNLPVSATSLDAVNAVNKRHFIAWNTCGGGDCPEGPQYDDNGTLINPKILFNELNFPEVLESRIAGFLKYKYETTLNSPVLYGVKDSAENEVSGALEFEFLGLKKSSLTDVGSVGYSGVLENVHVNASESTANADTTEIKVDSKKFTLSESAKTSKIASGSVEIESDECGNLARDPKKSDPYENNSVSEVLINEGEGATHEVTSQDLKKSIGSFNEPSPTKLADVKNTSIESDAGYPKNMEVFLPSLNSEERSGVGRSINLKTAGNFTVNFENIPGSYDCQKIILHNNERELTFSSGLLTSDGANTTPAILESFNILKGCDPCISLADNYPSTLHLRWTLDKTTWVHAMGTISDINGFDSRRFDRLSNGQLGPFRPGLNPNVTGEYWLNDREFILKRGLNPTRNCYEWNVEEPEVSPYSGLTMGTRIKMEQGTYGFLFRGRVILGPNYTLVNGQPGTGYEHVLGSSIDSFRWVQQYSNYPEGQAPTHIDFGNTPPWELGAQNISYPMNGRYYDYSISAQNHSYTYNGAIQITAV